MKTADIYARLMSEGDEKLAAALTAPFDENTPEKKTVGEWILRRISLRRKREIDDLNKRLSSGTLSAEEQAQILNKIQQAMKELRT